MFSNQTPELLKQISMFSCNSLKILGVSDNKLEIVLVFINNYCTNNFFIQSKRSSVSRFLKWGDWDGTHAYNKSSKPNIQHPPTFKKDIRTPDLTAQTCCSFAFLCIWLSLNLCMIANSTSQLMIAGVQL